MPICQICADKIPYRINIDGKIKYLKRKNCLKCQPLNSRKPIGEEKSEIEHIKTLILNSYSKAEVIKQLGLIVGGANYRKIDIFIKKHNINTDHFTGMGHLKGKTHNYKTRKDPSLIFCENSNSQTCTARKWIIKDNLLNYKCYDCGIDKWNGKSLPLELDHINGINTDHRIENLRFLCPNCHSQTSTYRGRNKTKNKIPPTGFEPA